MQPEQFDQPLFAQAVREFCDWVNKTSPADSIDEVETAMRHLAKLHYCVMLIAEVEAGEQLEIADVSDEEWKSIYAKFASWPNNFYSVIFDPSKIPPEQPVVGCIADDMADIYRDLKKGLSLFEHGHEKEALWQWRFTFGIHWGQHLTAAAYALHTSYW